METFQLSLAKLGILIQTLLSIEIYSSKNYMKIQEHKKAHTSDLILLPQTSKILADNAKMFGKYLGAYTVFQMSVLEFALLCS